MFEAARFARHGWAHADYIELLKWRDTSRGIYRNKGQDWNAWGDNTFKFIDVKVTGCVDSTGRIQSLVDTKEPN